MTESTSFIILFLHCARIGIGVCVFRYSTHFSTMMLLLMLAQIVIADKLLWAQFAGESFVTVVKVLVLDPGPFSTECHAAVLTRERLQLEMDFTVVLEKAALLEKCLLA